MGCTVGQIESVYQILGHIDAPGDWSPVAPARAAEARDVLAWSRSRSSPAIRLALLPLLNVTFAATCDAMVVPPCFGDTRNRETASRSFRAERSWPVLSSAALNDRGRTLARAKPGGL